MQYQAFTGGHIIRLEKDELYPQTIADYCMKHKIRSGTLSALGAVTDVTLSFYNLQTKTYQDKTFEGDYEVCSLTGIVGLLDGQPVIHSHGVFSDNTLQCFGGHIQQLTVNITLEVVIRDIDKSLLRTYDETTGLNLLNLF